MKKLANVAILTIVTTSAVFMQWSSARAKALGVCDGENHGPFTATLCAGEHLYAGAYLVNGNYLYMFDNQGSVDLFDISNSEDWQIVQHFRGPYENPSILDAFSFDDEEGCLCAWDPYTIISAPLDWEWIDDEGPDGDWYVELGSDGNMRVFDQGGNRLVRCYAFATSCS